MVAVVVIVKMVMPSFAILRCGVEGPSEPNHRAEWRRGGLGKSRSTKVSLRISRTSSIHTWELGKRDRGEDKGRSGQGRKVSRE